MGGKSSTSKQKVKIPREVLARYNAVNARAEGLADTPFRQYSTNPDAFVEGMNDTQREAMDMTRNFGSNIAGMVEQGTQGVGPLTQEDIDRYMSPYLNDVVAQAMKQLDYSQGQAKSGLWGQAIQNGAFGGDRGGVAAANMQYAQDLSRGSTLANLLNTGYNNALGVAQSQQEIEAQNYNRILQGAGIEGQVGLGAANQLFSQGSQEQATGQAGKTALYNQFQQQQSYPFQVAQFLANVAMGTGALSGSTTTTTTPAGFFSDRRLKTDIRRVGHTDDGLPIYKFKYKGDPNEQTHVGLMADEVEQKHPEAVGVAAGYKTVDYDKALPKADGGVVGDSGMYGLYGGAGLGIPIVPAGGHQLAVAGDLPQQRNALQDAASTAQSVSSLVNTGKDVYDTGKKAYGWFKEGQQYADALGAFGLGARRGGRINRAPGGLVPDNPDQKKLAIPDTPMEPTGLKTPSSPPPAGGNSAMDAVEGIGKLVKLGAEIIPMFLADGGVAELPQDDEVDTTGLGPVKDIPANKPAVEPTFDNLLHTSRHAIGSVESGGRYGIVGPATKRGDGSSDRPYGKYQVMGQYIPQWTQEALGKAMTPEEFLADAKAQDAVFDHRFGSYLKKTGNAMDAASMWFTGRPLSKAGNASDVLGTTAPAYVSKFAKAAGLAGAQASAMPTPEASSGVGPVVVPTSDEAPSDDGEGMSLSPSSMFGKAKDLVGGMMPKSPEGKLALMAGIFGMLASPNHYLLQAIGSGGLAGVQTYGDLIKLKNESMKNAMGIIQNRFTTLDGKTYYDRYTGQRLTQPQYAAAVNNLLMNTGVGGANMGTAIPGVSPQSVVETMPPLPGDDAGGTGGDSPVVQTAKEAITSPVPAEIPSPDATGAPPTAAGTTPPTTPATPDGEAPAAAAVTDPNQIKMNLLKDPNYWKGVDPNLNAPALFSQASEAYRIAQNFREKAAESQLANPVASKQFADQADQWMETYNKLRDQGNSVLNDAAKIEVQKLEKGVASNYETVEVLKDPNDPTSDTEVITKGEALKRLAAGVPVVTKVSPTKTTLKDVPENPDDPTSNTISVPESTILKGGPDGKPVVTGINPTRTELVTAPQNPDDPTSNTVSMPKSDVIKGGPDGKPVVTSINPVRTETMTIQPDPLGPKLTVPKSEVLKAGNPVVTEPNPIAAKKLEEVNTKVLPEMAQDNETRQPLINRVNALSKVMENYETGAWDTYKSSIVAQLRAAGFDVSQDPSAKVQQIVKDSVKQVYDQAKQIGNKVLVAEIEGLSKTVPGVGLQPDANRALLAQMKGMLAWDQKKYDDFMQYHKDHPEDYNVEQWQAGWIKDNPMSKFVKDAYKTTAPKGMSMPPMETRERNTQYNSSKGMLYWNPDTKKWSDTPVAAPNG